MSRFVRPETVTLTISDGDTLTVKRRLNSGEERALFARMYTAGVNGQLKVNPFQTGIAIVTAYLLDWSLTDDGKRVPIAELSVDELTRVLDGLDPTTYGEIRQAIEAHDNAVREEREQTKKAKGGETPLPVTSPSRSDATGDTNGSASSTQTSEPS
jgi:hypothetical protein